MTLSNTLNATPAQVEAELAALVKEKEARLAEEKARHKTNKKTIRDNIRKREVALRRLLDVAQAEADDKGTGETGD
ncbi:MAG: hypothetical protein ACYTEX_27755 [Planctomycetota bacterium]|jgi:predicted component of type VI protein secretion system